MLTSALLGFVWGCGAAAVVAVFSIVFKSVRSVGEDA